ncbi:MAG TPA: hypothetical protein VGJ59_15760 [Jatrophihabitantaceae bacterium]|jgi:Mg-chelatase subunit ChlD
MHPLAAAGAHNRPWPSIDPQDISSLRSRRKFSGLVVVIADTAISM